MIPVELRRADQTALEPVVLYVSYAGWILLAYRIITLWVVITSIGRIASCCPKRDDIIYRRQADDRQRMVRSVLYNLS